MIYDITLDPHNFCLFKQLYLQKDDKNVSKVAHQLIRQKTT